MRLRRSWGRGCRSIKGEMAGVSAEAFGFTDGHPALLQKFQTRLFLCHFRITEMVYEIAGVDVGAGGESFDGRDVKVADGYQVETVFDFSLGVIFVIRCKRVFASGRMLI